MGNCSGISNLTDPAEICEFARQNCSLDSIIPIETVIFCLTNSQAVRMLILIVAITMFSTVMGVAAFDYLSPNLTYIAEMSGLPQSLMGLTILAFGNGSVDVFGAFVALNAGEGGMAIGEIMGGAFFVITVVVGSMAIISPFKVSPTIPKDMLVLLMATIYSLIIISDGIITIGEASLGVCGYLSYCAYVVFSQYKRKTDIESYPQIPAVEEPSSPCDEIDGNEIPYDQFTTVRPSLYSAVDLNWEVHKRLAEIDSSPVLGEPRNSTDGPISPGPYTQPPYTLTISPSADFNPHHSRRRSSAPELESVPGLKPGLGPSLPSPPTDNFPVPNNNASLGVGSSKKISHLDLPKLKVDLPSAPNFKSPTSIRSFGGDYYHEVRPNNLHRVRHYQLNHRSPYSMKDLVHDLLEVHQQEHVINSPLPNVSRLGTRDNQILNDRLSVYTSLSDLYEETPEQTSLLQVMFPGIFKWKDQTWIHRALMIPMLPILTLLLWSIPLSQFSSSLRHNCLYSITVPFVLPFLFPSGHYTLTVILVQSLISLALLTWWGYLRKPLPPPLFHALVGFFMGMLWVILLATQLVNILTILGEVCHVSNTILGLTVFALGDSLGDFVSNITVAQIGYPTMAIAACYGGPIFTLLMGLSGASLFTMLLQHKTSLEISSPKGISWTALAIISTLVLLLIQMSFNGLNITKRMGIQLIVFWMIYTVATVYFFKDI